MKTSAAPYPEMRNPTVVYLMSKRPKQVSLFLDAVMPFQHGYCTFVIILLGPFTRLFINLTMCT